MTVTLAAPKLPLVLPPGESQAGNIVVADIGIPPEVIENLAGPRLELLTRESMREMIHPRESDSHKGDFGHVLIVAGSRGKTGAAHLAALGALRSGAGLVTVATPTKLPADSRGHGRGVHDAARSRIHPRAVWRSARSSAFSSSSRMSSPSGLGLAPGRTSRRSCRG